jgi:hypothetical protein
MKAAMNDKGFHFIDYTKRIKKLQDVLEIEQKMRIKNDDGSFKYQQSIIIIRMQAVVKKLPVMRLVLDRMGESSEAVRMINKDNFISFSPECVPSMLIFDDFLMGDEEVMCEICCEQVNKTELNVCNKCVYKCCEKCFDKKFIMSVKAGKPDGRCFGCREELVSKIIVK